jgi:hypothetical protein
VFNAYGDKFDLYFKTENVILGDGLQRFGSIVDQTVVENLDNLIGYDTRPRS